MLLTFMKKLYYFAFYCNYCIMESLADKHFKESPYKIHGWTWPMFVSIPNLATIDAIFKLSVFDERNSPCLYGSYIAIAIINFFLFTYKQRHLKIIEEYSKLPSKVRTFGIVFFTVYSILSFVALFVTLILFS